MPSAINATLPLEPFNGAFWTSEMSAMMPPSPSLSARMMNETYFSDTMIVSDQKTSDSTP
jgi:hypothetical protein